MSTSRSISFRSCTLIAIQGSWIVASNACVGVDPSFIDCDLISATTSSDTNETGNPCGETDLTSTTETDSSTANEPTSTTEADSSTANEPTSTTGADSNTTSESNSSTGLDSNTTNELNFGFESTSESGTNTETETDTGRSGELLINFDDMTSAPDYFNQSPGPIRDEYATEGVFFLGRSMNDGAGVISYETWPAKGGSTPNCLALNCNRSYQSGGVPCGDIIITLDDPATKVEFLSGTSYSCLDLTAVARNADGMTVVQQDCPTHEDLQPCSIEGSDIVEITLTMVPEAWYVVDDLRVTF